MTEFSHDRELRALWRGSDAALTPLALDEVKRRAGDFGDGIQRRNRREYVAAAFVAVAFSIYAILLPGTLIKIGSLLTVIGALVVAWQLARRTSKPDATAEAADILAYYHARLVREEHMLSRVGRWYLAPLVPGMSLFMAGQAAASGAATAAAFIPYLAFPLLLFVGVWWLNHRAARLLRVRIAGLERMYAVKGDDQ